MYNRSVYNCAPAYNIMYYDSLVPRPHPLKEGVWPRYEANNMSVTWDMLA